MDTDDENSTAENVSAVDKSDINRPSGDNSSLIVESILIAGITMLLFIMVAHAYKEQFEQLIKVFEAYEGKK